MVSNQLETKQNSWILIFYRTVKKKQNHIIKKMRQKLETNRARRAGLEMRVSYTHKISAQILISSSK